MENRESSGSALALIFRGTRKAPNLRPLPGTHTRLSMRTQVPLSPKLARDQQRSEESRGVCVRNTLPVDTKE